MKLKIKRPFAVYFVHGFLTYVSLVYALKDSSVLGRLVFIALTIIGAASLIRLLTKRNYFEIKDNTLFIHKNLFKTITINLREISRVELERLIFIPSKIYLKDGRIINYWNVMVTETEIKELLGQFNIPVE